MKKLLSMLLVMGILVSFVVPFNVSAVTVYTEGNFRYTVSNYGEATIKDYTGSATGLTIPNTLGEYPVTTIGEYAFSQCTSLKWVTIPKSVTTIGNYAFFYCKSMTSVTIWGSVTTIGDCAFSDCYSLTSVTILGSVTTIGVGAFSSCYDLTSVTIPNSVTTIGDSAFANCTSLTSIIVDGKNAYYCDVDGVLFNKAKTELIQYPIGNTRTSYSIPDSVTTIGYGAFKYCANLTSVTIPDSVTTIGERVFFHCESLISMTTPNSVTTIGVQAFCDCDSLTSVTIGNSVTTIGERTFYDCDSLTSVTIGNSVTTIGSSAFSGCESLTSVTIPNSVTTIGYEAFYGCKSLTSVAYKGTRAQWDKIKIGVGNDELDKVVLAKPCSLTIVQEPTKKVYKPTDTQLNLDGLVLRETFEDGTYNDVTTGFTTSGFEPEKAGKQTIAVFYKDLMVTFDIEMMSRISLNETSVSLLVGEQHQLFATTYPANQTVTWLSSNVSKATVNYGLISALSAGEVTITAQFMYEGRVHKQICVVTVVAVTYGDLYGDGNVSAADALEVLKSVVGKANFTEQQRIAADVDGNGKADAADALEILKKVVGKIQKFPVEE